MNKKFKTEFFWLKKTECNFNFYRETGIHGLYCSQVRHYWFCIPNLFGFRYTKKWGIDY